MAFLPGGRVALAVGEGGELVVLDRATGGVAARQPAVEVEPDVVIWTPDPSTGPSGRILRRPASVVLAGDEVLVGSADGTLRAFDATTLHLRRSLALEPQTLSSMWPLADGTVVSSGRWGLARVPLDGGEPRWAVPDFERCLNLVVVESRGLLYCGDRYGRLDERDLATGAVVRRLDAQNGSSGSLWAAAAGTELVSFGTNEPVVSRWRLDRSGPITRLVAPGWSLWDFNHTGKLLLVEDAPRSAVVSIADGAVSPVDGLFSASWNDADSLVGIGSRPGAALEFARAEVDPDGRAGAIGFDGVAVERLDQLASNELDAGKRRMLLRYQDGTDQWLTTYDPTTRSYGPTIAVDGLVSWAISREGDRIVAGTNRGILVFDAETGEQIGAIADPDLRAVIVTTTDQLFVGSVGGELTQHDLDTLEPIRSLGGSRGLLFGGMGAADGTLLVTHGGDRAAALYDVESGTQLGGPITIGADERNLARLSPDGRWLAVGGQPTSGDGPQPADGPEHATQLWSLDPADWVDAACAVAGRNLTRQEWATHIGSLAPYRSTCPDLPSG